MKTQIFNTHVAPTAAVPCFISSYPKNDLPPLLAPPFENKVSKYNGSIKTGSSLLD